MSDSEDDYMSDKLLQQCGSQDIRPGLVFDRTTKRQYEMEKKKKEIEAKRPKTGRLLEEELREKGLNTAISSDNKGFKLLEKLGFKPGEGLGKSKSGRTEPIKVEVKVCRSGLGTETKIKEKLDKIQIVTDKMLNEQLIEFKDSTRVRFAQKYLHRDFYTAQKVCEDLDLRKEIENPIQDFFWTRDAIKKRRDIQEEEDEEDLREEFDLYICEENLTLIIDYLREKHLYCMFCAFVATDEDDLTSNCPGPYRIDHDEG